MWRSIRIRHVEFFSNGDLDNFTKSQNLKLLTAIGHDGHVYAIEKNADYDSTVADGIV